MDAKDFNNDDRIFKSGGPLEATPAQVPKIS